MTLDDYLEAHRRALKDVHRHMKMLEEHAAALMNNINQIERTQLKEELERQCIKPTQE
ncbi:hypothetical protein EVB68_021 [Rhizobium phage RHph_Y2_6]|uniref:Uncharacterized protein n=1 Tax=Rhizobium phage RHph_Y2_6 TaxID=2509576 RepID=A0A7S5QZ94_9CAUD|nr:hypothetical protein PP748_gp021 [Rhizobium phage RHph_Y2_6]QIG68758.1 hypothetical protein EVB68_021 [Rhizobium phage RHph_Y2_6]